MIDALAHTPVEPPSDRARYSQQYIGSEYIGSLCFQAVLSALFKPTRTCLTDLIIDAGNSAGARGNDNETL